MLEALGVVIDLDPEVGVLIKLFIVIHIFLLLVILVFGLNCILALFGDINACQMLQKGVLHIESTRLFAL